MISNQEYWQDTDGDGVPDGVEQQQYSDPHRRDSDRDGIPDRVEITNNTNPRGKNVHEVYEFCTGINVVGNADNWVSGGFNGYMNSTFPDQIPSAIRQALTSKQFEGAVENNKYGIIGREVVDKDGDEWSVLAILTNFEDDKGRTATGYRYFAVQGRGHLADLIEWHNQEKNPVFNPFDIKKAPGILQEREINVTPVGEIKDSILEPNIQTTPQQVHQLAQKDASEDLISWAWGIKAVECPEKFNIILPSTKESTRILREARDQANISSQKGLVGQKLDPLKNSIRILLNNPLTQPRIERFTNAFAEAKPYLNKDLCTSITNEFGYQHLGSFKSYNSNSVRLLLLSSILNPELIDYNVELLKKSQNPKDALSETNKFLNALYPDRNNNNFQSFDKVKEYLKLSLNFTSRENSVVEKNIVPKSQPKPEAKTQPKSEREQLKDKYFETVKQAMGWQKLDKITYDDLYNIVNGDGTMGIALDKLLVERNIINGESKGAIFEQLTQSVIVQKLKQENKITLPQMQQYITEVYEDRCSFLQEKYNVVEHIRGQEKKPVEIERE